MTILPQFPIIFSKLISGMPVDGHIDRLPAELQDLAREIACCPRSSELRKRVFCAGLPALVGYDDLALAVESADPLAEIPGAGASFADIAAMLGPISWAWPGWLANGFVTILASESGTGKSALALRLCNCFLRGQNWPDGAAYTGNTDKVLWVEAEAAQAINLERARAWGLPLDRILTPLANPLEDLSLSRPEHEAALIDVASREDVRLVIVDSLSGADNKAEKGTEESATVKRLAQLARDIGKPILVTHHLRKKSLFDGDAITLDRLRGASALVQTARLVWALDIPDPQAKDWKRLSVVKSNLAKFPDPVGVSIGATGVIFGAAPSEPKTETVTDKAIDLLVSLLAAGPQPAKVVDSEFKQAGISPATMNRAKEKLKVISVKDGSVWKWGLPSNERH